MAAVEFIQKMDMDSLSIDPSVYTQFVTQAKEEFTAQHFDDSTDALDEAEAKAEELFLKAKAALQRTGQKASAALNTFKESKIARQSMDHINRFVKELTTPKDAEESYEEDLARAMSMSVTEQPLIDLGESDDKSEISNEIETDLNK